ncbi:hypothetical protein [Catenovulum agarivorans]|uniref:alpha-L-rhamnosidase-related protein n=1 Tax=Catenovulum agarivorans TaxID=1172192 RepID=UPI0002F12164|nr:hypothetical protein [Catenovulum agarivorans]
MKNNLVLKASVVVLSAALIGGLPACSNQSDDTATAAAASQQLSTLYLRGAFNNWGTTAPMTKLSDGKYQVKADISLGIHGFKIASEDWGYQLLMPNSEDTVLDLATDLDKPLQLIQQQTDLHSKLMTERPGIYLFTLEYKDQGMSLTVKREVSKDSSNPAPHLAQAEKTQLSFSTYNGGTEQATFSIKREANGLRTYVHSTTQVLRDPVPQYSVYSEVATLPYLRSGDTAFDALFALAVDEMKLNSVNNIQDESYNSGQAISCDCFETGEKWNYVWTRDLSYAAYLSLGLLDPVRVKNSLDFKLSGYRDGVTKPKYAAGTADGLQIIQDTGSGGSWPISTDRITWAFGAQAALNSLHGDERTSFAKRAFTALSNTVENDRLVAFDGTFGLYNGEQSFLDWREQTYANWVKNDLSSMATAKAVSTNAGHYQAIRMAQYLAEEFADNEKADRYKKWADDLKQAINRHLWIENAGLYSSLTAAHFDNTVMPKYDWLGQSLAIITGIASDAQAKQILANYPHGPMGAPVIFPQQPDIPVYHNRAIWPFVTAYGLKAAKVGNNVAVANAAYDTLIRGAALNLSNMENLEWVSAQPIWLEKENPSLSGPVVNSKRQLWSVAAYLSMVIDGVFGVDAKEQGISISPYVTTDLRSKYFADQQHIELNNLTWHGKTLNIQLVFPSAQVEQTQGVYAVKQIKLNGKQVRSNVLSEQMLNKVNQVEVVLSDVLAGETAITRVSPKTGGYDEQTIAPKEPELSLTRDGQSVSLQIIDRYNQGDVVYQIYKNGQKVVDGLTTQQWQDSNLSTQQACYAVAAVFTNSGIQSHHSQVKCATTDFSIVANDPRFVSNVKVKTQDGSGYLPSWGAKDDSLQVNNIEIAKAGTYAIQFNYVNLQYQIDTGITCGVKWLVVKNANGKIIKQGVVQLPHTKKENGIGYSTPLTLDLQAGSYQINLYDYYNMSYLTNNQTYFAAGGKTGAVNQFDLYGVRIMPIVE